MREIANSDLQVVDIPPADAGWDEILRFAQTYNGYKALGSFEACAEIPGGMDRLPSWERACSSSSGDGTISAATLTASRWRTSEASSSRFVRTSPLGAEVA